MIRAISLALAALPGLAQAFVLIDDFTVGPFEGTRLGNGTIQEEQYGLEFGRVAFGDRFTRLQIGSNPPDNPVTLALGGGEARVTSGSQGISTILSFDYGFSRSILADLSAEDEIWVDLLTEGPKDRIADFHDVFVRDANGVSDIVPNWISHPGGVRFRKQSFDPQIDWSKIEYLSYRVRYSFVSGPHPVVHSTQRIYAVPEPVVVPILAVAAGLIARRRARR